MNDTPITDAEIARLNPTGEWGNSAAGPVGLCRKLERELAKVTRDRDAWRACAEGLAECLHEYRSNMGPDIKSGEALARFRELK